MAKYQADAVVGREGLDLEVDRPVPAQADAGARIWCSIDEIAPVADKQARAQSIAARMSMGRVYFPRFTRWFPDARDQMLKFPHSGFDDFVDTLSLIGLGLMKQMPARGKPEPAGRRGQSSPSAG